MLKIDDSVWAECDRLVGVDEEEPALVMLIRTGQSVDLVLTEVARAAAETASATDQSLGEWAWRRDAEGVVIQITEPDDFRECIDRLGAALGAAQIDGELVLYADPGLVMPGVTHLLECRMRINGDRIQRGPKFHAWKVDEGAMSAIVPLAIEWCLAESTSPPVAEVGVTPPAMVEDVDQLDEMVREALSQRYQARLWTTDPVPRIAVVDASTGRATLIACVSRPADWQSAYQSLREVLIKAADLLVYGLIKHGSDTSSAARGDSLQFDWPPRRVGPNPAAILRTAAFEDSCAPDAFACQLLGPGYSGRQPTGDDWELKSVGVNSTLIEHRRLDAWFEAEFVPFHPGLQGASAAAVPPVLESARQDFVGILYSPDLS